MTKESIPVGLAKQSLEKYLTRREVLKAPAELPAEFQGRAGAFVSLKKNGQLRGCIGTFGATKPTIADEIIANAISAATQDPRFPPVQYAELAELSVSVDILSEPEQVKGLEDLDQRQYGVIVRRGGRTGLLLPDLEGVDSVQDQVAIARQKAGIAPDETIELYRFSVTRYT